ncbi:MAG TPA: hypothetical protein VEU74_12170 [Gemmatimonadales bacterium]|nr:hypothetical protein [Gemmatimonadales bacterium]
MTQFTKFSPRRWCARWAWTLFLMVGACQPPPAQAANQPMRVTVGIAAAGDTAKLYISWTAANKATGALLTVTVFATNGTWSALPNSSAVTPAGTAAIVATSTTADSGTFVACMKSTGAGGAISPSQTCNQATWRRILQPPPIVNVDSLKTSLTILRNPVIYANYGTTDICTFGVSYLGAVIEASDAPPVCDTIYQTQIPAIARLAVTPRLQAQFDSVCITYTAPTGTFLYNPVCPIALRPALRWQLALR